MIDIDLHIDWMIGVGNAPQAKLTVPGQLETHFMFSRRIWRATPDGLYVYAQYDDIYQFLAAANTGIIEPRGFMGFGGRRFDIEMVDGTTLTTNNAWSGNAGHLAQQLSIPLVDVSVRFQPVGGYFAGFAITFERLQSLVELQGYYLLPTGTISDDPVEATKIKYQEATHGR